MGLKLLINALFFLCIIIALTKFIVNGIILIKQHLGLMSFLFKMLSFCAGTDNPYTAKGIGYNGNKHDKQDNKHLL